MVIRLLSARRIGILQCCKFLGLYRVVTTVYLRLIPYCCFWNYRAFLLLPNIYVHQAFGKMLFVGCDLLVGYVLYQILRLRGLPDTGKEQEAVIRF